MSETLIRFEGVTIAQPFEGNEVFAFLPESLKTKLFAKGLKAYPWLDGSIRFVCHWATPKTDIDALTQI